MDGAVSFLVNCSILFTELPVLQRPAAGPRPRWSGGGLFW